MQHHSKRLLLATTALFCALMTACGDPAPAPITGDAAADTTSGSDATGGLDAAGTPDGDAETTGDAEVSSASCDGTAPGCYECLYDGPVAIAFCDDGQWACDQGEFDPDCTPDDYFDCSEFHGEVCCDIDGNATSAKCPSPGTPFCPDGSDPVFECDTGCPATPDTGAPPEAIDSTQTVSFRVTNDTDEVRYIALAGAECEGWGIANVPAQVNFQCGCECPVPVSDFVNQWKRMEPGTEHVLTWDARRLETYDVPQNCCEQGWGDDAGIAWTTSAARQPVEPGSYDVFVGVASTLPAECYDGADNTVFCNGPDFFDSSEFPPTLSAACSDLETVTATFELPATGDVEVAIDLGASAP